jgi:hypothetical protein
MAPDDHEMTTWNCVRCGRTEELRAYDYHAYHSEASYGEVPRSWKEIVKVLQGQTVYHDLMMASALVCGRCVRRRRWMLLGPFAAAVIVLGVVSGLCRGGYQRYMADYQTARQEFDQLMLSEDAEVRMPGLRRDVAARTPPPDFVEQQSRLQRAKDAALHAAVPLWWVAVLVGLTALAVGGWGLWELRPTKIGQSIAVRCMRPVLRGRGLRYVKRGHLRGGRAVEKGTFPG